MASLPAGNAASPLHGLPPLPPPPPDHPDASNPIDEALQRRRRQEQQHHVAPFPCFRTQALPLRSMPQLGSPLDRAQEQQQQPPFPFPRLEKPSHMNVPLPLPSAQVASYGCPAPQRHFSSAGYRDDHHAGQTTPFSPSHAAALLGHHTHLCHTDREALHYSCPVKQCPHRHGQFAHPSYLPGDDAHVGRNPAFPREFLPPNPAAAGSSAIMLCAEGTGCAHPISMYSYPCGRQVGGDACAGEAGEGWDLRRSQHLVGIPSQQSGGGGPKAVSGWLRCGATTNAHWSKEEQAILESGMNEYASQTKLHQYAQISLDLRGGKTIRDVALRCKYYTDIIGDWSLNGLAQLDAEWEYATQSDGFRENDDPRTQLFERNDLIFNQIIQNQMSSKTHDIINLFNSAYGNILKLHNTLDNGISEDVSEDLKKLKPLHSMVQLLKPPKSFR